MGISTNKAHQPQLIKVKLGSPNSIHADKESFKAVIKAIDQHSSSHTKAQVFVDANGGWRLEDAKTMMQWLAAYHIAYIDTPG